MEVKLYAKPQIVEVSKWIGEDSDLLGGTAAALCTGYEGNPINALNGAITSGHESVVEHGNFTFIISDVSRVLLAQLTRHRIASFSVQSQRYCGINATGIQALYDVDELFVVPNSMNGKKKNNVSVADDYRYFCLEAVKRYLDYVEMGVPEEDARFVLPQGIKTKLMLTMNCRELRHFLALRLCNRAQWEIRELAEKMYAICKKEAPEIFKNAGCGCMNTGCTEGKKSCGHSRKGEL